VNSSIVVIIRCKRRLQSFSPFIQKECYPGSVPFETVTSKLLSVFSHCFQANAYSCLQLFQNKYVRTVSYLFPNYNTNRAVFLLKKRTCYLLPLHANHIFCLLLPASFTCQPHILSPVTCSLYMSTTYSVSCYLLPLHVNHIFCLLLPTPFTCQPHILSPVT
jgi:hypothetical protein